MHYLSLRGVAAKHEAGQRCGHNYDRRQREDRLERQCGGHFRSTVRDPAIESFSKDNRQLGRARIKMHHLASENSGIREIFLSAECASCVSFFRLQGRCPALPASG